MASMFENIRFKTGYKTFYYFVLPIVNTKRIVEFCCEIYNIYCCINKLILAYGYRKNEHTGLHCTGR